MIIEKAQYKKWPNCYRLANGVVDLVVTTDIGPRIIRFGFVGERNEFVELPEVGQTGGDEWRAYGGHRLWHAPEQTPRSYFPDNFPVQIERRPEFVRLIQETEPTTGIQKEMDIYLDPEEARVEVVHRLINHNLWAVELAPWALSVMAPGGVGIAPLPPRGTHPEQMLPVNSMALWAYTDMADPRWTWGREFIMLRQDELKTEPQKVGLFVPDGWAAYAHHNHLFVKTFEPGVGATHPDFNCNVEFFTNEAILEVETLGPLAKLEPDTAVTHTETWHLFRDIPQPKTEADVTNHISPIIKRIY